MDRKLTSGGRVGGSDFRRPPDWILGSLGAVGVFTLLWVLTPRPAPPVIINNIPAAAQPAPVVNNTTNNLRIEITHLVDGQLDTKVITSDNQDEVLSRNRHARRLIACEEFGDCD